MEHECRDLSWCCGQKPEPHSLYLAGASRKTTWTGPPRRGRSPSLAASAFTFSRAAPPAHSLFAARCDLRRASRTWRVVIRRHCLIPSKTVKEVDDQMTIA